MCEGTDYRYVPRYEGTDYRYVPSYEGTDYRYAPHYEGTDYGYAPRYEGTVYGYAPHYELSPLSESDHNIKKEVPTSWSKTWTIKWGINAIMLQYDF